MKGVLRGVEGLFRGDSIYHNACANGGWGYSWGYSWCSHDPPIMDVFEGNVLKIVENLTL